MKNNPIIFIDDDIEDLALMEEMANEIYFPNHVMTFNQPQLALDYLKSLKESPLFILSDINMPRINGFELRGKMMTMDPDVKNAPFILLSTSKTEEEISRAGELNILGYYKKSNSFAGMKEMFESIMSLVQIRAQT